MRSRARRRNRALSQNLDSFLDILTNTVGVLMFISLFATLIATGSSPKTNVTIQTPLVSSTQKKSLWFEIQGNKVSYLNLRDVRKKEVELTRNLPNCNQASGQSNYQSCLFSVLGRQGNFTANTDSYRVRTVDEGVSLLFQPKSPGIGETTAQLTANNSAYRQVLARFNPEQDYLIFIVRPDSFETFRTARKQAWDAGYEVGWEPHPQEEPIKIRTIIGSELPGGRSPGVQ